MSRTLGIGLLWMAAATAQAGLPPSRDVGPTVLVAEVVDAEGKPAAGAEVWLASPTGSDKEARYGMATLTFSVIGSRAVTDPEVLGRAKADATGKVRIEVPARVAARRSFDGLAAWAVDPATGLAGVLRIGPLPRSDDRPLRIKLAGASDVPVTVVDPAGKAVAGAKVRPAIVDGTPVPDPIAEHLTVTTDADEVRVEAPGFGRQRLTLKSDGPNRTVALAPVGGVHGRLVLPEGSTEPVEGAHIRLTSRVGGYEGSGAVGEAVAVCDASGQFVVPTLAAGMVELQVVFDPAKPSTLRGELADPFPLAEGEDKVVDVPLHETVEFDGIVREKGTERPVQGVSLAINGRFGGDHLAVSDAEGRYAARVVRELNQPFGWPIRIPSPFYWPLTSPDIPQGMPPRGTPGRTLPPLDVVRGVDVAGAVVDENGRPVADTLIDALGTARSTARTDADGKFTLAGVDPLADLKIQARRGALNSGAPITIRPETTSETPLVLTIRPGRAATLSGRVVDRAGRPIAGASIWFRREVRDEARVVLREFIAGPDGRIVFRSDADGRFRAPRPLAFGDQVQIEASAIGRLPAQSASIVVTTAAQDAPDLALSSVEAVSGVVVDNQGAAVGGARVFQSGDGPIRTETRTDAAGKFTLPGFIDGSGFVFASKDGWRTTFRPIEAGPIRVVLANNDEADDRRHDELSSALPADEEKALAMRLFLPYADRVMAHGKDAEKFRLAMDAIEIDPVAVAEKLEGMKFADSDYVNMVRTTLAGALAKVSLDDALAQIESWPSAEARASGYISAAAILPERGKGRLRELIDQGLLNAKAMKSPQQRVYVQFQAAEKLIDLGDKAQARRVLDEADRAVVAFQTSGKGNGPALERGLIAAALARIDLPKARSMLDEVVAGVRKTDSRDRTYVFDKFYGGAAFNLAAESPADAEELLSHVKEKTTGGDRFVVAVCSKMADVELPRAERIAATSFGPESADLQAYTFGLMARSCMSKDKTESLRLLEGAFDRLERLEGRSPGYRKPAAVAAALLPTACDLTPERFDEFLARTLALRQARASSERTTGQAEEVALLAMLIGRYDRDLAAWIIRPIVAHADKIRHLNAQDYISQRIYAALAVIDPRQAVERVEAMPDDPAPGTDSTTSKNRARIAVAKLLALHGEARWQYVYEYFAYLWTPAQRYL